MSSLFELLHSLHPYLVSLHPHISTNVRLLWEYFLSPLLSLPSRSLRPPTTRLIFFLSMSPSLLSGGFNALWKWIGAMKAKQDKFGCLMWLLSLLICLIGSLCVCGCWCCCVKFCFFVGMLVCIQTHAHPLPGFLLTMNAWCDQHISWSSDM